MEDTINIAITVNNILYGLPLNNTEFLISSSISLITLELVLLDVSLTSVRFPVKNSLLITR